MIRTLTAARVAQWLWERDGKPDGYDVGESNKRTYQREADDVFEAIKALGYKVVPQ